MLTMCRYHYKCMKIARGKVKELDPYTCPICDWRVKIPRDAARPKLEDLVEWQAEIANLPFQPDEEDCLAKIIDYAQDFRLFLQAHTNPAMMTHAEVATQRFFLRKIEGAEILLSWETNFFRQELHRWAPVAPNPPPTLEVSLSTRKPRPTKQQKLMAQLGIENPQDLPQNLRTKQHSFTKRKSSEPHGKQSIAGHSKEDRSMTPTSRGRADSNRAHGEAGAWSRTSVEPHTTFPEDGLFRNGAPQLKADSLDAQPLGRGDSPKPGGNSPQHYHAHSESDAAAFDGTDLGGRQSHNDYTQTILESLEYDTLDRNMATIGIISSQFHDLSDERGEDDFKACRTKSDPKATRFKESESAYSHNGH